MCKVRRNASVGATTRAPPVEAAWKRHWLSLIVLQPKSELARPEWFRGAARLGDRM